MSLRDRAAADLRAIVEDPAGFSSPVDITSPEGVMATVLGMFSRTGMTIDPETGQAVTSSKATLSVTQASLTEAGFTGTPRNIAERNKKPWIVTAVDIHGVSRTYKVLEAFPDRGQLGLVTCTLEEYLQA